MNPKRKAELQRKLSIMPVPKPPDGLLKRLKADIPQDLAEVTGGGARTPASFNLRVAASFLLVLASTAFVTLYLLRGGREMPKLPAAAPRAASVPALVQPKALPEAELTVSLAEPPSRADAAKPALVVAEAKEKQLADSKDRGRLQERGASNEPARDDTEQFAPTAVSEAAGAVARPTDKIAAANEAPAASAGAPAAMADQSKLRAESVARNITVTAAAPAVVAQAPPPAAAAASLPQRQAARVTASDVPAKTERAAAGKAATFVAPAPPAPREMFGISIDPAALSRVQKSIEGGQVPPASSIDVEAIVSYLASPPAMPGSGVSFDVEASREPDVVSSRAAMIRFTIDTSRADVRDPSVGSNARLEIVFNSAAIQKYRIFGNGKALTLKEPLLFDNASVTGVIEVTLNNGLAPQQEVATLKLRYVDAKGRSQMTRRTIRVTDLNRSWEMASFRHRLATLGAIWSESIKGGAAPPEVIRSAQDLATEAPRDTRARDLADVANASSRLDGPGSSGSGLR